MEPRPICFQHEHGALDEKEVWRIVDFERSIGEGGYEVDDWRMDLEGKGEKFVEVLA